MGDLLTHPKTAGANRHAWLAAFLSVMLACAAWCSPTAPPAEPGKPASAEPVIELPPLPAGVRDVRPKKVPKQAIVIIPIKGRFGEQPKNSKDFVPVISGHALDELVDRLSINEPAVIVLDIGELKGGSGKDLVELLETVVRLQRSGKRLVAWPTEVYGPSAEIALACKDIISRTNCRIAWRPAMKPDGKASSAANAAETEFGAPPSELLDEIAEWTQRSAGLEAAMRVPESELWWSVSKRSFHSKKGEGVDWKQVDGPKSRVSLSNKDLLQYGVSRGTADDMKGLRAALAKLEGEPIPADAAIVGVYMPNQQELVSFEVERAVEARGREQYQARGEKLTESLMNFERVLAQESAFIAKLGDLVRGWGIVDSYDEVHHDLFEKYRKAAASAVGRCAAAVPSYTGAAPPDADPEFWDQLQAAIVLWKRDIFTCRQRMFDWQVFPPGWDRVINDGLSKYRATVQQLLGLNQKKGGASKTDGQKGSDGKSGGGAGSGPSGGNPGSGSDGGRDRGKGRKGGGGA